LSSGLEAAIVTSFDTTLPSVLVGGKNKTAEGGVYDWLKSCSKDHKVWSPNGASKGLGVRINEGTQGVMKRAEHLREEISSDPEVVTLATGLLTDSMRFCTALVNWVDTTRREMVDDTPYSEAEIWDMLLECFEQIFEELHEARVGVVDAARISEGLCLWGMLKAHRTQERHLSDRFKDDPALTGIFVRRVLLHDQDHTLKTKILAIEAKQGTVDGNVRSFKDDAKQLKTAINTLKSDLKDLKK